MKRTFRFQMMTVLSIGLIVIPVMYSHATDYYWIGESGPWDKPDNWSTGTVPQVLDNRLDNVYLTQSDSINRTVTFNDVARYAHIIEIGAAGAGAMTFNLQSGRIGAERCFIDGNVTVNQSTGSFDGIGSVSFRGSGWTYNLSGGDLWSGAVLMDGSGTFNQTGNSFVRTDLQVLVGPDVTYNLSDGDVAVIHSQLVVKGTFNQTGGSVGALAGVMNSGTYNFSGGDISSSISPTITNNGTFNLSGAGTRTINGDVVNTGAVKTTHTVVVFNGIFTNNGAYISDPATQYFNTLIIGQNGYLVGQHSDKFYINGDFISNSTMNTAWNTKQAYLGFIAGKSTQHAFYITGADYGAVMSGYANNFSWGTLDLSGNALTLLDGNTDLGGALYLRSLLGLQISGDDILNISSTDGLDVYYMANLGENGYLHGLTYDLAGGGHLKPIRTPEPTTMLLLGFGFIGLAGLRRMGR
jgi:hypothetical protein